MNTLFNVVKEFLAVYMYLSYHTVFSCVRKLSPSVCQSVRMQQLENCWTILLWNLILLTYLLTELSTSWGAVNCAAPQEPPSISWNPKVQYRVHKSPPLVPILSHVNPIHSIPSYLSKIHFNIVHPPTSWSWSWSWLFLPECRTKS
jgi:hypothetical protein